MMNAPITATFSCVLALTLSQCRCVSACYRFFTGHASTGSNTRLTGNLPPHPITWEQFVEANKNRGLEPGTLRMRFVVADANGDGFLTPEEIVNHRVAAAQKKGR